MNRIAVCIKQVPLSDDVDFDAQSGTMRREGKNVISAFDLRAIAFAVHLGRQFPDVNTTAITMGPPQAADALREALAMGVDQAVHLIDPLLAGADSLATAHALAAWLRRAPHDLVLLGKYSLDAETGQVGPQLAELLGMAQVTGARTLRVDGRILYAERETDYGYDEVHCRLPVLVTCAERLIKPVKVASADLAGSSAKPLRAMSIADLGVEPQRLGLAGSPTRVGAVRRVEHARAPGQLIQRADAADAALEAVQQLRRLGCSLSSAVQPREPGEHTPRQPNAGRDVWIACESDFRGRITAPSLELLTRGATLAAATGGALTAILVMPEPCEAQIQVLSDHGADRVLLLELAAEHAYSPDTMAEAVDPLVRESAPAMLLTPATERGRDWLPRLAARLGVGMTGDAVDLAVGPHDDLIAHKPAFGGSLVAEIHSRTRPHLATVRPGMLGRPQRVLRSDRATVVRVAGKKGAEPLVTRAASHVLIDDRLTPLDQASTVVGVGMGLGGVEGVRVATDLARALNASLCGTRPVCDEGWLPRQLQVGLTGKGLNAELYIALGISGNSNHTIALKGVDRILAVNSNPDAPIFKWADIGIVGSCDDVGKALIDAFARLSATAASPN